MVDEIDLNNPYSFKSVNLEIVKRIQPDNVLLPVDEIYNISIKMREKNVNKLYKKLEKNQKNENNLDILKLLLFPKQSRLQSRVFNGFNEVISKKKQINYPELPEIKMISNLSESFVFNVIRKEYKKNLIKKGIERRENFNRKIREFYFKWKVLKDSHKEAKNGENVE